MFTGIVTDIGRILLADARGDMRFRIATRYDTAGLALGASVACSGVCLTVVDRGQTDTQGWFEVDVSAETQAASTANTWEVGTRLNLERALRVGDELGGHIVSVHVDGVALVTGIAPEGDSTRVTFAAPADLARFIAPKGSVALDGTSLTVNAVAGTQFGINFIPHTKANTTWDAVAEGDRVNLEVDTMARYVARLREAEG
ncbi:MAG: riboflavin synthase [Pseudomonadota bacterium]